MVAGLGVEDGCERLVWIEEERFGGERRGGCECHFREAERQSRPLKAGIYYVLQICVSMTEDINQYSILYGILYTNKLFFGIDYYDYIYIYIYRERERERERVLTH